MIWLIGGTGISREVSLFFKEKGIDHIVTVATEYGKKLYENVDVRMGRLDVKEMSSFIEDNNIELIVDATHPYAVDISKNSIEVSEKKDIPHVRLERKMCDYREEKKYNSYEEVVEYLDDKKGNVLVTTGSNNLSQFGSDLTKYYFRILPVEASINKVREIGISPKNIIGIQGPFTTEFNRAIIRNYNIKYLITKESGSEGGEIEKIEASMLEDVEVLVIKRPEIRYKKVIYSIDELVKEIRSIKGE